MNTVDKIIELMEQNNITAKELCIAANLSSSSITEWKKGKAKPSVEAIVRISNYFNVTTDYLLKETTASKNETIEELVNNSSFKKWINIYKKANIGLSKEQVAQSMCYFEGYIDASINQNK